MSLPFSISSAQDWIVHVPSFLASLEEYSDYVKNAGATSYLANTLVQVINEAKDEILNTIHSILKDSSTVGKFVMIQILFHASEIWTDLVEFNRIQPALTALALSPDKLFTKDAIQLSQKLESISSGGLLGEKAEDTLIYEAEDREFAKSAPSREDFYGSLTSEKKKAKRSAPPPSPAPGMPMPTPQPAPKASPPPAPMVERAEPSPPPPSVSVGARAAGAARSIITEKEVFGEAEEELELAMEEPVPAEEAAEEALEDLIKDDFKSKDIATSGSVDVGSAQGVPEPKSVFTHVHYFNRMNSRKTYPFTVSLTSAAKKVRARKMHILSGERETEKQAEFELDHLTRQIMVELLISGCLVQPNFQYVDPDNLPVELTFYITPLVEAGYQASKIQGQLLLKNDVGIILQNLPLSDIFVVSNRISKIAAIIGAVGGGTLPALDFLFGVNLQDALTGQLEYTAPDIASSVNIRSLITTSQIAIFFIFISIGLLWWWRKGRSKRAPEEKLAINLP
ncbi:MAG: hypothetical protein ACXABU_03515 [Candidatus Hodarchaeales archaeon]|jgi:hypothetical protein